MISCDFHDSTNSLNVLQNSIFWLKLKILAQNDRHEELRSLYVRAEGILDRHESESKRVQEAAAQAKETSERARKQITDSLDLIKELKMKLTRISNNDVKSTRERIINLREAAKTALDAAKKAKERALDLQSKVPNVIPDFSDEQKANIMKSADDINETANVSRIMF